MQRFINSQDNKLFIRAIGVSQNYLQEISHMDTILQEQACYKRITNFPVLTDATKIVEYHKKYHEFLNNQNLTQKYAHAFHEILNLYHKINDYHNATIERNLMVSILYWADLYLSDMINQNNSKFVCSGKIGYKEYLFCYFAMQLNIQVMLLLPEGDLKIASEYLEKSQVIQLGTASIANIPEFKKKVNKINTVRPANWKQQRQQPNANSKPMRKPEININRMMQKPKRRELHYEELAKLAESVVIIGVYDRNGNFKGSGSGIAISRQGYILTNCHVIHDGRIYSVRLENDEEIYTSCQVIKYHTQFDLAVIKINKELKPLKIYDGKKELLRGQKVIAIGSPMGLFNSVSDGIISGFRKIDNLDMIQFTAPVADGSCGGALLNTYGEVIGITTAHVRRSENMNLAVSYQQVLPFILGFLGG